jgi:hypothetical protein
LPEGIRAQQLRPVEQPAIHIVGGQLAELARTELRNYVIIRETAALHGRVFVAVR